MRGAPEGGLRYAALAQLVAAHMAPTEARRRPTAVVFEHRPVTHADSRGERFSLG